MINVYALSLLRSLLDEIPSMQYLFSLNFITRVIATFVPSCRTSTALLQEWYLRFRTTGGWLH